MQKILSKWVRPNDSQRINGKMDKNSRTYKSLKNAQVSLFYYVVQLILGFWSRKVFFDYLGSELMGLDTTASNLLGMLNLAELGIGMSVGYFLYKPLYEGDTVTINRIVALQGWMYRRIAFVIILAATVMMMFFPMIFAKADVPAWCPYATFGVMLYGSLLGYFINFKSIVLGADQKGYKVSRVTQGANILFKIIVLLIMPYTDYPFLWYIGMNFFGSTFGCVWLCYIMKKEYPWLNTSGIKGQEVMRERPEVMKKTGQAFFHRVGGMVLGQMCPLLMYKYTSLTVIAYYGNYLLIVAKISAILGMVFASTGAAVGSLIASGDREKIVRVFWELIDSRLCMSWIGIFSIYFLIQPFITVWLGGQYLLSNMVLTLLLFNEAMNINRATVESFLLGNGQYQDIWSPIAEGIMTLVTAFWFGDMWGISGVLLGIIVTEILFIGIWKPYFLFSIGLKLPWYNYFVPYAKRILLLAACAVGYYCLFGLYDFSVIDGYLSWSIHAIVVFLIIAVSLGAVFQIATSGMKNFTKRMIGIIFNR